MYKIAKLLIALFIILVSNELHLVANPALDAIGSILKNHKDLKQPNELLAAALNVPIIGSFIPKIYPDGMHYIPRIDQELAKAQGLLLETAILAGANLESVIESHSRLPLELLYAHKDLFLEHLNPNNFMKCVLRARLTLEIEPLRINETFVKYQSELLQAALQQGANLNDRIDPWITHININTLSFNKELLLDHLCPSRFLLLVIFAHMPANPQDKQLQLELAQLAINLGVEPNFITNSVALCPQPQPKEYEELIEAGLAHIITNPQSILNQRYKNLNAVEALEAKMPYIIHHIWLTHPCAPREILEVDIANLIATKNIFSKAPVQWQQIVWTNDPQLIPESLAKLEKHSIEVKSIYDHQDDLKLFTLIEKLIYKKLWGQASDSLRLSLLEQFGGVYADLNYIFNRDTTSETHKYNFFTSTYHHIYIANFLFGSSPHHPILQEALRLLERNFTTPPNYIKSRKNQSPEMITSLKTANPIYLAYYSQANKDGHIDVIYPSTSHFRRLKMNFNDDGKSKNNPNDDKLTNLLREVCPMIDFYDYIQSKDICASEEHFIGYDSGAGNTWITQEQKVSSETLSNWICELKSRLSLFFSDPNLDL